MKIRLFIFFGLLIPLIGCEHKDAPDPTVELPTTTVQINGRQFILEKATTVDQRIDGLTHKSTLGPDRGMIFIYPDVEEQARRNHDVGFPVDAIFLDDQANVVSIQQMKANDDTSTQPVQAQYVIELNLGTAQQCGVKVGNRLSLPPDAAIMLPTTTMQISGQKFIMEIATTPPEQERGLMRRLSLAPDHGMIFPFPSVQPQIFWNHDVHFPLDIIFLDDKARIVSIQQMKPYDDTNTQAVQAQYVVELNKGTAEKLGLKVGDQMTLPADAKSP